MIPNAAVKQSNSIKAFTGEYRFLSNFYEHPVVYEGVVYRSVENAYQAAKTKDKAIRRSFEVLTPGKAKKAGRSVPLRPDWELIKEAVMETIVFEKFAAHPVLANLLVDTYQRTLIEGNYWHDLFWGCCYCDNHKWAGENRLGLLLMCVRSRLKSMKEQASKSVTVEM